MCFTTTALSHTNDSAIKERRCNRGKPLVMNTRNMNMSGVMLVCYKEDLLH
jgi:hypothetical protein